jgi:hypothetical protein
VDDNATRIPVVVTYAVDGEVREERVVLPVSEDTVLEEGEQSDRGLPLSLWLGVAGVAVAAAAAVVVRRR